MGASTHSLQPKTSQVPLFVLETLVLFKISHLYKFRLYYCISFLIALFTVYWVPTQFVLLD